MIKNSSIMLASMVAFCLVLVVSSSPDNDNTKNIMLLSNQVIHEEKLDPIVSPENKTEKETDENEDIELPLPLHSSRNQEKI